MSHLKTHQWVTSIKTEYKNHIQAQIRITKKGSLEYRSTSSGRSDDGIFWCLEAVQYFFCAYTTEPSNSGAPEEPVYIPHM